MKTKEITAICTSLVDIEDEGQTGQGVSSLMDTWLKLRMFETDNERNRGISVIKSRGMKHSNQIREYLLTDTGVQILDVYLGAGAGLLMGSARAAQEAREKRVDVGIRSGDPAQEEDAGKKPSLPEGEHGLAAFGIRD